MSDNGSTLSLRSSIVRFGRFKLSPSDRVLLADDHEVRLGSRALDILLLLVERAGDFVANDEIMRRIWPRSVVVEANLRVHMSGLRKALSDGEDGARLIVNVPNRGYCFIAPLVREAVPPEVVPSALVARPRRLPARLPACLNRVIGQEVAMRTLAEQVGQHRLVTLVGAGGIGKTTIALTVAEAMALRPPVEAWSAIHFVDLASLADPGLVPSALAAVLGLSSAVSDAMPGLIAFLHDKSLLVVFDNCEHLAAAVTALVEDILRGAPGVHVLATSREPLRAQAEWVHRLQALALPADGASISVEQALRFSAIELFVERACAVRGSFVLTDADVQTVAQICRRVDGMPLAIELATARIDSLGLRGIAAALDDCFALLSKGRRTAMPRHQTLRATLDWSVSLLSTAEQTALFRLSVFAGSFTLGAATTVAADDALDSHAVMDIVSDLVAKSLINTEILGDEVLFRMLDTTRTYAREKLRDRDDSPATHRRHARQCLDFLRQASDDWGTMEMALWRGLNARRVDDLRAAIAWCFGSGGDELLGLEIVSKAALAFFQLSFASEYVELAGEAVARTGRRSDLPRLLEFELLVSYGHVLFHVKGLYEQAQDMFARALAIAKDVGDRRLVALGYSTSWMGCYGASQPERMLEFVDKFEALSSADNDAALTPLYDRMKTGTFHFLGRQDAARTHAERALAVTSVVRPTFLSGLQIDRRVSINTMYARVLWLQGLHAQAEAAAATSVAVALGEGESVSVGFTLGLCALPLAVWMGRLELARERADLLLRHTLEHGLVAWRRYGLAFDAYLRWLESGALGRPPVIAMPPGLECPPQLHDLLAATHSDYVGEAVQACGAGWSRPEVLRVLGVRLLAKDVARGEELIGKALAMADEQHALMWSLRAAESLATSWHARQRGEDARKLLDTVLARFVSPDDHAPDLVRARATRRRIDA